MKKNLVLSGPSNLFSQKLGFGNPELLCTIIKFKKTNFFLHQQNLYEVKIKLGDVQLCSY